MKIKAAFNSILSLIICACLLLSAVSCAKGGDPNNDPTPTPDGDNTPPPAETVYIVQNGASDYSVAYCDAGTSTLFEDIANAFAHNLYVSYDVELEPYEASEKTEALEILFGAADRAVCSELKTAVESAAASKGEDAYAWGYAYKDGKLAFYANSDIGARLGMAEFSDLLYYDDICICVPKDLFTVNTKSQAEYDEENSKEEAPKDEPINLTVYENSYLPTLVPIVGDIISGRIAGENSDITLTLPSRLVLSGDLEITNITLSGDCTIIANGHELKITESVKMPIGAGRLTVYGGTRTGTLNGDTHLTLLGARYAKIYGGGMGTDVNGSTYITLGGTANSGESIDDSSSNISGCKLYGGGQNASVTGGTYITLCGQAVAKYIVGTGTGTQGAMVSSTNILIDGGKVMNVIGGSENSPASGLNVVITVTQGLVESIFGGCQAQSMSGNVNINLLGGDISRRVYAGCYNNYGLFDGFTTTHSVNGTLTVTIGPYANLASGKELSSDNDSDTGIFVSSRIPSRASGEIGRIIFLDGSYDSQKQKIGPTGWISASSDSFHLYEIACSEGGSVSSAVGNQLFITPDQGYKCTLNGKDYLHNSPVGDNLYTLPSSSGSVTKITITFTEE